MRKFVDEHSWIKDFFGDGLVGSKKMRRIVGKGLEDEHAERSDEGSEVEEEDEDDEEGVARERL